MTALDASAAVPVRLYATIEKHIERLRHCALAEQDLALGHFANVADRGELRQDRARQLVEAWDHPKHRLNRWRPALGACRRLWSHRRMLAAGVTAAQYSNW